MIHGLANGVFLDDKRFWPIFERAAGARRADLSASRRCRMPAVMDAYYKDYAKDFPMVMRAAWGFTVETATQAIRLVLSRRVRRLSAASRSSSAISARRCRSWSGASTRRSRARARKTLSFRDVFCEHFYITTSGNFSNPALLCCVMEMGIDRILFAVDWPFVANTPGGANGWRPCRCATRTRSRS